jgi:FAD dependent oxidoreductase
MATYALTEREIPLDDSWDVVVAGGGPAGCTAAAAAAEEGAKTLLIEATGALGGMGTSGLVPAWCPFSDGDQVIYRGLAEKIFRAAKQGVPHVPEDAVDWVAINPEHLKRVYDDLVSEAGVSVLFNTALAAVDTDGVGAVRAVITSNKAGLTAHRAGVYVDATGDADLAAWAGAAFDQGEPGSGEVQPASHCFMLCNVDENGYANRPTLYGGSKDSPIHQILASGRFPEIVDTFLCHAYIGPGTLGFNAGHIWDVDSTDPESLSKGLIQGRRIAKRLRDGLAEFVPQAFANAHLANTGSLLGVRESRRIVGEYTLTVEDYFARRSFPDEICRNAYWIDIHTAKSEIATSRAGEDVTANLEFQRIM